MCFPVSSKGIKHSVQRPDCRSDWLQTKPQQALFQGSSLSPQVLFWALLRSSVPPHGTWGMARSQTSDRRHVQQQHVPTCEEKKSEYWSKKWGHCKAVEVGVFVCNRGHSQGIVPGFECWMGSGLGLASGGTMNCDPAGYNIEDTRCMYYRGIVTRSSSG